MKKVLKVKFSPLSKKEIEEFKKLAQEMKSDLDELERLRKIVPKLRKLLRECKKELNNHDAEYEYVTKNGLVNRIDKALVERRK